MMQENLVLADYDAESDVAYVSFGSPVPGYCDETDDGLLVRYSYENDNLCGITVLDMLATWPDTAKLADRISIVASVSSQDVLNALNLARSRTN